MARLQKSSRTATKPAAPTTASVPDALTGVAAFGTGKTDAQMVRRSNLWRDNYNPLRGLVMSRLITIFEAAERGAYAELQLLLRKAEKRYPVLKGFVERLTSSIEELSWDVKVLKNLPEGATPEMAEKQRKFLRGRYDKVKNLTDAFGQITLAEIRGYAVLQKHRYEGGPSDGAVKELYWLEPWVWCRDGYYGDFYYNEISRFGVGLGSCAGTFGESCRIGGESLPRTDFVLREVNSPLYEIALIAFVNWLMARKDWAAFVEIFGLAKGVVIMPPNIAVGKEQDYQTAAEKVSDGVSGALPAGSDIKFPTAGVRGEAPFEKYGDAQDKDFVMAATSGVLSMLQGHGGGGLNQGPHKEHGEEWEKIAKMKGRRVNETLRADFDEPELAAEFPNEPVCVQFTLAVEDEEDINTAADTVVKLEGANYQTDEQEVSTRTGFKVKRVVAPKPVDDPSVKQDESLVKKDAKIQNSLRRAAGKIRNTDDVDVDGFIQAIAGDLQHLRDRVASIEAISDPDLRAKKFSALLEDWDQLVADITADPESAQALATVNPNALLAGLRGQPVKNRLSSRARDLILNSGNPNHDDQGRFASGEELAAFHDEATAQGSNEHRVKNYRAVDSAEAARIKSATGIDVSGHSHAVDNYALRHINKEHGNAESEKLRGQLPVTREDIARLPEITANPDKIEHAGETKLGREGIRYTKQLDGRTVVVEEVRTKAKLLVPVSIQKFKNRVTIDAGAPISTSKTLHPKQP